MFLPSLAVKGFVINPFVEYSMGLGVPVGAGVDDTLVVGLAVEKAGESTDRESSDVAVAASDGATVHQGRVTVGVALGVTRGGVAAQPCKTSTSPARREILPAANLFLMVFMAALLSLAIYMQFPHLPPQKRQSTTLPQFVAQPELHQP